MAKVSVIIPIYNVESYLRKCLDSVISQTFKDIEIIVINDCSTDNSLQIIKEYQQKDDRIILINLTQNSGVSISRNIGIQTSKAEYITFIDSDDWIDEKYIEILYTNIKKYNYDTVCCDFYLYDNNHGLKKHYIQNNFCYDNIFDTVQKKQKILTYRLIWSAWAKIYKKDFLLKNEIFFKRKTMEDILFFYEVILVSDNIKFIRDCLYFYRVNRKNSIMNNKSDRFVSCIELLFNIKNLLSQKGLFETYKESFYSYSFLFLAAEIEVLETPTNILKQTLKSLKTDLFNDDSVKIKIFDKFPYKIRTYLFYFCFKYNINYRLIGKFLRIFYLFFYKVYNLTLSKTK